MSIENNKKNTGPVHFLGTPMNEHIGKLSDDLIPSDRGESTDPTKTKNNWKRVIAGKLKELDDSNESIQTKFQNLKFIINLFGVGSRGFDKEIWNQISPLIQKESELGNMDFDSPDFEVELNKLKDEVEKFYPIYSTYLDNLNK
ncbi:MAG: hypothetical protein NTZ44_01000 [Candidatus Nomurabacteria bacterium]|nr:hypothetical protein [Candidatus Nomurabacteria bacterium]